MRRGGFQGWIVHAERGQQLRITQLFDCEQPWASARPLCARTQRITKTRRNHERVGARCQLSCRGWTGRGRERRGGWQAALAWWALASRRSAGGAAGTHRSCTCNGGNRAVEVHSLVQHGCLRLLWKKELTPDMAQRSRGVAGGCVRAIGEFVGKSPARFWIAPSGSAAQKRGRAHLPAGGRQGLHWQRGCMRRTRQSRFDHAHPYHQHASCLAPLSGDDRKTASWGRYGQGRRSQQAGNGTKVDLSSMQDLSGDRPG